MITKRIMYVLIITLLVGIFSNAKLCAAGCQICHVICPSLHSMLVWRRKVAPFSINHKYITRKYSTCFEQNIIIAECQHRLLITESPHWAPYPVATRGNKSQPVGIITTVCAKYASLLQCMFFWCKQSMPIYVAHFMFTTKIAENHAGRSRAWKFFQFQQIFMEIVGC